MYNKVFLIGNLTKDPEVRYTTAGISVAKFTLAINRYQKSSSENGADVDFINITAWRKLADICKNYLKKGQSVAIEGSLQIRKYEKNGEQKVFTEVVAENMQMLGRKSEQSPKAIEEIDLDQKIEPSEIEQSGQEETNEEVPF